jgi:hypothetical protein
MVRSADISGRTPSKAAPYSEIPKVCRNTTLPSRVTE